MPKCQKSTCSLADYGKQLTEFQRGSKGEWKKIEKGDLDATVLMMKDSGKKEPVASCLPQLGVSIEGQTGSY